MFGVAYSRIPKCYLLLLSAALTSMSYHVSDNGFEQQNCFVVENFLSLKASDKFEAAFQHVRSQIIKIYIKVYSLIPAR